MSPLLSTMFVVPQHVLFRLVLICIMKWFCSSAVLSQGVHLCLHVLFLRHNEIPAIYPSDTEVSHNTALGLQIVIVYFVVIDYTRDLTDEIINRVHRINNFEL